MISSILEFVPEIPEWIFGSDAFRIVVIFVIAYFALILSRYFIKRTVRGLQGDRVQRGLRILRRKTPRVFLNTDASVSLRRAQRAETMGSILRNLAAVAIFTAALFAILRTLDVVQFNQLVASTTVLTAVIAFGAQNIVRDILAGFFIVVEDQYGVGDFIDLGDVHGTVEEVSLRITRLRNADGTLWQVPNGEIKRVGNKSQKWSRSLVGFYVTLDNDAELVREVIETATKEISEDPVDGAAIIDEPEVWGPDSVDGQGLYFRIAIKTQPLEQWRLSRVVRARVKAALDEAGIRIASPLPDIYGSGSPGVPLAVRNTTEEPE